MGASAEARLAWPQAPSPSGHLCKPTRPQGPRVVFRRAPILDSDFVQGHFAFFSEAAVGTFGAAPDSVVALLDLIDGLLV